MAQYLSEDLRIRVIRAVEGGLSRNAVAQRFGIHCPCSTSTLRSFETISSGFGRFPGILWSS
jgi:transposase